MRHVIYAVLFAAVLFTACDPSIQVTHTPVVPTSSQTVTFTATVLNDGDGPVRVQILVNAVLVHTCNNLVTGNTCTYVGGPYPGREGSTVSYAANARDTDGTTVVRGYYYFGVTNAIYTWSQDYIPARVAGSSAAKEDLVFHRAGDYEDWPTFITHVGNKIYNVLGQQEIIKDPNNMDTFNFYIYKKTASTANCGTVHADANADMPWRDDDAILHVADMQDCTNAGLSHFTAEGSNTKAFLHESGHAIFGLADEYDGPTGYFQPADEPNIWSGETGCRNEQSAKGRNPAACWQFTARSSGWWGIHQLGDGNVMQVGNVGNPWGIEAAEHMRWYFNQF